MSLRFKLILPKCIYDLTFERTMSVICGDSGIGKTHLVSMLATSLRTKDRSIIIQCSLDVDIIDRADANPNLYHNKLLFMDEDVALHSDLTAFLENGCWVACMSRSDKLLREFKDSVYTLVTDGKYRVLRRMVIGR